MSNWQVNTMYIFYWGALTFSNHKHFQVLLNNLPPESHWHHKASNTAWGHHWFRQWLGTLNGRPAIYYLHQWRPSSDISATWLQCIKTTMTQLWISLPQLTPSQSGWWPSWLGVTKPISSIPLFPQFSQNTAHWSSPIWLWTKGCNRQLCKIINTGILDEETNNRSFSNPHRCILSASRPLSLQWTTRTPHKFVTTFHSLRWGSGKDASWVHEQLTSYSYYQLTLHRWRRTYCTTGEAQVCKRSL